LASAEELKKIRDEKIKTLDENWEAALMKDATAILDKIEKAVLRDPHISRLDFTSFEGRCVCGTSGYNESRYVEELRNRIRGYGYEVAEKVLMPEN
jgi:hypothetical protein